MNSSCRAALKTLLLRDREIEPLLEMNEALEAVEQAFREKGLGRVQMPAKTYLYYEKYNGDLRVMPAYMESMDASAVKVVNVHPNNRRFNLPTVMAVIILIDPKTGAPQAIMDGTKITAVRTGAAAGVATKYLARAGSSKLGIVGAGVQASTQLKFMLQVADISEVRVYDVDDESKNRFVTWASRNHPDVKSIPAASIEEVATSSDIICTVTPSRKPIIIDEWVDYGTHINAIGADAPGKEELDPAILKRSKVVIDDWDQAWHSGEINVPVSKGLIHRSDIHCELSEIIVGKKEGRTSPREVTVFDSTGLAIQDTVVAKLVYKKATEKKVGTEIELSTLPGG
ncbi:alanine dehydrogenase [Candidatus Bathyarchaeota archaeon]|nr:alanine dehydrogenase [Candidatus Bathyarchaeota archaeon]